MNAMDEHIKRRECALREAGAALDAAMMKLTTDDRITMLGDARLVDQMHRALGLIVSVVGKPWREDDAMARLKDL